MENHPNIICCPRCQCMYLEGIYEKSNASKKILFGGPIWGLISALRNKPSVYWRCTQCGETFPMK